MLSAATPTASANLPAAAGSAALGVLGGPVGVGLAVGLPVATTLISGILNLLSGSAANKKALKQQEEQNRISNEQLALNKRQQEFTESEANLNRQESAEQRGYGRIQNSYQRGAELWAQSMNAQQASVAPLIRRV